MIESVKWTKRAAKSFDKIVEYITNEWSEKVANKFILKVKEFISSLQKQPKTGKIALEEKGIRGFVLSRHTTVYRIKNNQIILLNFFDNRQNPNKKRL